MKRQKGLDKYYSPQDSTPRGKMHYYNPKIERRFIPEETSGTTKPKAASTSFEMRARVPTTSLYPRATNKLSI